MKHVNLRPWTAALFFFAMSAVLAGCGGQADEVLSLVPAETTSDVQSAQAADEQAASAEAQNAGAGTSGGTENTGAEASGGAESVGVANGQETSGAAEDTSDAEKAADELMAVYICGAVMTPGVYEVTEDMRLVSLVELAGGFAGDADETYWNLAQKLDDGAMYYIPTVAEAADEDFSLPTGEGENGTGGQSAADDTSTGGNGSGDTGDGSSSSGEQTTGQSAGTDGLISINTATLEELTTLPGIGATKAAAIITYRETNGPFTSIDEIMNVTGIGESTYEKLKDSICL